MALLRAALAGCLLLAGGGFGLAQKGKGDKAKLIGTWTFVKATPKGEGLPPGAVLKVEFTKDGKVNTTATFKGKTSKQTGNYTLKGDQLTTVMKDPGGKVKEE